MTNYQNCYVVYRGKSFVCDNGNEPCIIVPDHDYYIAVEKKDLVYKIMIFNTNGQFLGRQTYVNRNPKEDWDTIKII